MTRRYSETEVISSVERLTRSRLKSFLQAQVVMPVQTDDGPRFRQIDLVRMELLCELTEEFELGDEALAVVMSLIDQLHGVRAELRAVLDAVAAEPPEVCDRICKAAAGMRRDS